VAGGSVSDESLQTGARVAAPCVVADGQRVTRRVLRTLVNVCRRTNSQKN